MTSLLITGPGLYNAQLSIYPGVFSIGGISPGILIGAGEWDRFMLGVTIAASPLGIGAGSR